MWPRVLGLRKPLPDCTLLRKPRDGAVWRLTPYNGGYRTEATTIQGCRTMPGQKTSKPSETSDAPGAPAVKTAEPKKKPGRRTEPAAKDKTKPKQLPPYNVVLLND